MGEIQPDLGALTTSIETLELRSNKLLGTLTSNLVT